MINTLSCIYIYILRNKYIPNTSGLCDELPDLGNGTFMVTGETEGSNAVYACNDGYELIGEQVRTCLSNGAWSPPEPTCLRKKNTFILC